jgi:holliday junction DNA helicase RuvA
VIASLRGIVLEKAEGGAVIEAGGVGYEVHLNPHALSRLAEGREAQLFIAESVPLYGGGTSLYGFLSREDKELFEAFKEHVPGTGAKKSLEYLERASRSLSDFRRAVLEEDARILTGAFGFTKKTAEKLLAGLKDKLGRGHGAPAGRQASAPVSGALAQALEALSSLGYKAAEARGALDAVSREASSDAPVEELVRRALRRL